MKCKVCGSEYDPNHWIIKEELEERQLCFHCNFWKDHLINDKIAPPHTTCMIDGTHYIIGDEDSKSRFRGFGGAKFTIVFNDGYKVTTTNLWCQGEPDKNWIDKFPNNAHFENDLKWRKIGETNYLCLSFFSISAGISS